MLANEVMKRFLGTTVDGLNEAIVLLLEASQLSIKDVSAQTCCLFDASTALRIRFYIKRDLKDLQKALALSDDYFSMSTGHDQRTTYCEAHCALLLEEFAHDSRDTLKLARQAYNDLIERGNEPVCQFIQWQYIHS